MGSCDRAIPARWPATGALVLSALLASSGVANAGQGAVSTAAVYPRRLRNVAGWKRYCEIEASLRERLAILKNR